MNMKRAFLRVGSGVLLSACVVAAAHGWTRDRDVPIDQPGAMQAAPVFCLGMPATHVGGPGNDVINGTPGNDVIVGLGGADRLYGGGGFDLICGGAGNDILDGQGGNDVLNGGAGNDAIIDMGGSVIDIADYSDSPAAALVRVNNVGGPTSDGWGGTDSMDNIENVNGSPFSDTINGDNLPNKLLGGGGDDTIFGLGGADTIDGEAGTDLADGGAGFDGCFAEVLVNCP